MSKLIEFEKYIKNKKKHGQVSWLKISLSPQGPLLLVFIDTHNNQFLLGDNLLLLDITAFS